jgi:uncharacterized membrane protein (DUF485 family)
MAHSRWDNNWGIPMQQEITARIRNNPKFEELVRKRTAFGWRLSVVMLVIYYLFVLLVAFAPEVLGTPLFEGSVITIGIPLGVVIIVSAFVLTGIYVRRANTEFDELNRQIIEDAKK